MRYFTWKLELVLFRYLMSYCCFCVFFDLYRPELFIENACFIRWHFDVITSFCYFNTYYITYYSLLYRIKGNICAILLREKCPNTEFIWTVSSRIQSKCDKTRSKKSSYLDTFYAVLIVPSPQINFARLAELYKQIVFLSDEVNSWIRVTLFP